MDFDKKYVESQYTLRNGTEFTCYFEKHKHDVEIKQKMNRFCYKKPSFFSDYVQNAAE